MAHAVYVRVCVHHLVQKQDKCCRAFHTVCYYFFCQIGEIFKKKNTVNDFFFLGPQWYERQRYKVVTKVCVLHNGKPFSLRTRSSIKKLYLCVGTLFRDLNNYGTTHMCKVKPGGKEAWSVGGLLVFCTVERRFYAWPSIPCC